MNKDTYITTLQMVIRDQYGCGSKHVETVPVHEKFRGKTIWRGDVEVFDLNDHPKAKRCYGWSYGEPEEVILILEVPPVDSAQSAVKVGAAYQIKKAREGKAK